MPLGPAPSELLPVQQVQYWGGWDSDDDDGPFWRRPSAPPRVYVPRGYVDPRFEEDDDSIAAQEAVTIARSMGYRAVAAPRRIGRAWVVVGTGRAGERVRVSIDAYTGRPLAIREIAAVPPRPLQRPGERIAPDAPPMPIDPAPPLREGRVDPLPDVGPDRRTRPSPAITARAVPVPLPRPDIDGHRPQQPPPPLSVTPDRPFQPPAAAPAPEVAPVPPAPPTAALPQAPAREPPMTAPPAPPVAAPAPEVQPQPAEPPAAALPPAAEPAPAEPPAAVTPPAPVEARPAPDSEPAPQPSAAVPPAVIPPPVEPAPVVIPDVPAVTPSDPAAEPPAADRAAAPTQAPAEPAPARREEGESEGIMVDGRFLGPDGQPLPGSPAQPGVRRIDPPSRN